MKNISTLSIKKEQVRGLIQRGAYKDAMLTMKELCYQFPKDGESWLLLGRLYWKVGSPADALVPFKKAVRLLTGHAEAIFHLANTCMYAQDFPAAEQAYRMLIRLKPDFGIAYNNMGSTLLAQHRLTESIDAYLSAIRLQPDLVDAYYSLANVYLQTGNVESAIEYCSSALRMAPGNPVARSNLLYILNNSPRHSAREIAEAHGQWGAIHDTGNTSESLFDNLPDPDRKLRTGYISADLQQHSVAYFFEPILEHRDKERFEVICYSNSPKFDSMSKRLRKLSDQWKEVHTLSDDDLYRLIRADRIDILVDLAGHTAGNRLLVFSKRPAPLQITYLGYPNTTGMPSMGFRITDELADPPGVSDELYTEKLVRLAGSFLCYKPPSASPGTTAPPCLEKSLVTFGSFNNFSKMNSDVFDAWALLLQKVPGAELLIKNKSLADEGVRRNCLQQFDKRGIAAERLSLIGWLASPEDHLKLYGQVDIALDTFPYNGTTTTFEAIWMGVPVVSLLGDTHAGRVGFSILSQLGLRDLVADGLEEYIQTAVELSKNQSRLIELRKQLRNKLTRSLLCDGPTFCRNLESVYRGLWKDWCNTQAV